MSFLSKFNQDFQGLNLGDRPQQQHQQGSAPQVSYSYNQDLSSNPYPNHHQSQQPYPNHGYQPYPGAQQPFNSGQPSAEYQPYHIQQQSYLPQGDSSHNPVSLTLQQSGQMSGPASNSHAPAPQAALTSYAPLGGSHPPCPAPPRWVAHWSENDRRWYYVETTGRASWQPPLGLPPLPGMPAYLGNLNRMEPGNGGQVLGQTSQSSHANQPDQARPSLQESERSSSHTILAAAGGFMAGGVAGYLIKDRIDKQKAKKRHGCIPADFADFAQYPEMDVGLVCNVCDQTISGPYAHCKKCDGGDWDVCRDCIAQGETCEGNGKHNLVKVYPKYYCDICGQSIQGDFYHCARCNDGDWDTCQKCLDKGHTCKGQDRGKKHDLVALYIPLVKLGKNSGRMNDGSDTDSD